MHNKVHGVKKCASATMKKSDSNERINDLKTKKLGLLRKSNSSENVMRKSTSLDNLKVKRVRSTNSLFDKYGMQSTNTPYNEEESQGFDVDEYGEMFLDELYPYIEDEQSESPKSPKDCEENHNSNDDLEKNKTVDMMKHIVATNCPGIIYDCIQKKEEIIHSPDSILHIVQDHVTSHAIQSLSDHLFHI
jgi:hypothetical protein